MKLFFTIALVLILGLVQQSSAAKTSCQSVCENFINHFITAAECEEDDFECYCAPEQLDIYAESYALCANACNRPTETKSTWKYFTKSCKSAGVKVGDYDDYLKAGLADYVEEDNIDLDVPVVLPVLVGAEEMRTGLRARDSKNHNMDYSEYYGHVLNSFWLIFVLLSFIRLITIRLYPRRGSKPYALVTKFRKTIMLPAVFGYKHITPVQFGRVKISILMLRWQTLVLILYGILNLILVFVDYDFVENNPNYNTWSIQVIRFYVDRTGILATAVMPVLLLFGGRNNILMLVTGWSFETFNVFHRWVGRAMFFHAMLHSIGFTAYYLLSGGRATYIKNMIKDIPNLWGIIATILAAVVMFQASYTMRHYWYEFFLVFHIVLVAVFVPALRLHLSDHGYLEFIWAAIAVWVFDRVVRICRIILAGAFLKADVQVISSASKIVVAPSLKWKAQPGQYVFVYVLRHNFWESHPFSIMDDKDGKYTLVSNAKSGMTKRLHNSISAKPQKSDSVRVWIEGPYGESYPIARYDTVLLLAGGIGVTAIMSYALDLKRRNRNGQHVIFYWMVRDEEALGWVTDELKEIFESEFIEMHIVVTCAGSSASASSEKLEVASNSTSDVDSEKAVPSSISSSSIPVTYQARPDISAVIKSTIVNAPSSVAVVSCGPNSLADEARAATTANMESCVGRVDYFEDAFGWA
ncbi:ferric reductase NAD binding domain-containing protein [Lipomyces arxii]|uniref:ferric reductase NAD binding domain-containing protein n=1 Tax=Lipomyces arxii TaxID=56418 RepID=UPI0034CF9868